MGYRGADLDLRTSRTWSATSTDLMGGFEVPATQSSQGARAHANRSGPIWVDEPLLAAANHAYEVAMAHRASEVRLEHLVHALTRVEGAAAILDSRGAHVVPLRRDSAMVIASEIPVGLAPGSGPRRSLELEETLRLASAHASHAGRPASVDDVLHVLIDLRGDHPATELLLRHLPRGSRDFWSTLGPPRAPYPGHSHFVDVTEADSLRNAAGQAFLADHGTRLSGEDTEGPPLLEEVNGRLGEIERALQPIKDRLDVIEEAVLAREGDGALVERLSALGRLLQEERVERSNALGSLTAEVRSLAGALGYVSPDGETHQTVFAERLQGLAADLEQHRIELGTSLGDRIAAIEKSLEAQADKVSESHNAYCEELAEVHEALMKLNTNQHTLAGSIEQLRSNEAGELHIVNARIGMVLKDGADRQQLLEQMRADLEKLTGSASAKKSKRWDFSQWLFGTDDWVRASWQKHVKRKA
jgi:hypothetical protein